MTDGKQCRAARRLRTFLRGLVGPHHLEQSSLTMFAAVLTWSLCRAFSNNEDDLSLNVPAMSSASGAQRVLPRTASNPLRSSGTTSGALPPTAPRLGATPTSQPDRSAHLATSVQASSADAPTSFRRRTTARTVVGALVEAGAGILARTRAIANDFPALLRARRARSSVLAPLYSTTDCGSRMSRLSWPCLLNTETKESEDACARAYAQ